MACPLGHAANPSDRIYPPEKIGVVLLWIIGEYAISGTHVHAVLRLDPSADFEFFTCD